MRRLTHMDDADEKSYVIARQDGGDASDSQVRGRLAPLGMRARASADPIGLRVWIVVWSAPRGRASKPKSPRWSQRKCKALLKPPGLPSLEAALGTLEQTSDSGVGNDPPEFGGMLSS